MHSLAAQHNNWLSLLGTSYQEGLDHAIEECIQGHSLYKNTILHRILISYLAIVNYTYDMGVNTLFHKFHGRLFACAQYLILMRDIVR